MTVAETPVRTLVVWCPDWPVVAAGVTSDQPAAVLFANRVVAGSAAARAEGVRRGLRRREAQARCPDLLVIDHDPARDARAFEPVVAALEACAPGVEIVRPGVCAVATRGPSRYFGGDEALAATVEQVVGHGGRAGIADGPFAAGLAARRRTIVAPGETAAFLAPFPVAALDGGLGDPAQQQSRAELADLLRRLGLRTLGAFAALPAADVLARFGPDGALAHRLARGLDDRPLAARTPPPEWAVQMELEPPAQRVDTAAFAAKALADQLHERLRAEGLMCTRIAIEAQTEHGESLSRVWRHDGALTAAGMAERVRWQLDGWLAGTTAEAEPTGGLSLLRLVPEAVVPDDGRQLGFWGGAAEADERAARAFARVQGMLGPAAVCTAVLSGGRGPAEQVTLVPWGDPKVPARPGLPGAVTVRVSGAGRTETPPWPGRLPAPSPSVVHPVPVPAELVDGDGVPVMVTARCLVRAAPARLSVAGGRWAAVVAWGGPWPVDERWWDASAHRRRARFQVVCTDGAAHLMVLEGGRWWVEATYE